MLWKWLQPPLTGETSSSLLLDSGGGNYQQLSNLYNIQAEGMGGWVHNEGNGAPLLTT